jgi:fumarylacetoacetase
MLDDTHDLKLQTWVRGAQGHREFPIQNLPLCVIASPGNQTRGGVAIGEWMVDLHALAESGILSGSALDVVRVAAEPTLNGYMALTAERRALLRQTVSKLLRSDAAPETQSRLRDCLLATDEVTLALPATIGDYSDFFAGMSSPRSGARPPAPLSW